MFILGVDLGQAQDFTALAVIEAADPLLLRHIERLPLGTPYTAVVARIQALLGAISGQVVIDATGVGRPVLDSLRTAGINPVAVSITAGRKSRFEDGMYYVPKRELVRALITALEGGSLKVAQSLPMAAAFMRELEDFEVKISAKGNDSYNAASGHDDIVIAAGLAVWWANIDVCFAPERCYEAEGCGLMRSRGWLRCRYKSSRSSVNGITR